MYSVNVGINILSLQLTFTFVKSPVWQGKSPATGHVPDSKKCLVCEPNLMFVTHLFKLAYDDMATSNIQPPSSAGVTNKEEQK